MAEKPLKTKLRGSNAPHAPTERTPYPYMADQLRKMEARLLSLKALGIDVDLDLQRIAGTRRTLGITEDKCAPSK